MKFMSELLNKTFDTAKECEEAEKAYEAEQARIQEELEKAVKEKAEKDELTAKDRKALVKDIDAAKTALDETYTLLNAAKDQYRDLVEKAKEEGQKLISAANEKVKEASKNYYACIKKYNDKYGTYYKTITNKEVLKNIGRIFDFDNFFNDFWF